MRVLLKADLLQTSKHGKCESLHKEMWITTQGNMNHYTRCESLHTEMWITTQGNVNHHTRK